MRNPKQLLSVLISAGLLILLIPMSIWAANLITNNHLEPPFIQYDTTNKCGKDWPLQIATNWERFDLGKWMGKEARFEIYDRVGRRRGVIGVNEILMSDKPRAPDAVSADIWPALWRTFNSPGARREMAIAMASCGGKLGGDPAKIERQLAVQLAGYAARGVPLPQEIRSGKASLKRTATVLSDVLEGLPTRRGNHVICRLALVFLPVELRPRVEHPLAVG